MNKELQVKHLENLMASDLKNDTDIKVLDQRLEKIESILDESDNYISLNDNLDFLLIICQHHPKNVFLIVKNFLERLKDLTLSYSNFTEYSEKELQKYFSKDDLKQKAFNILRNPYVCYPELDEVISFFFLSSSNVDKVIQKSSREGLESMTSFNEGYWEWEGRQDFKPQIKILDQIDNLIKENNLKTDWLFIIGLVKKILSNQFFYAQWSNYNKITFTQGIIPETSEGFDVRRKCFVLLKKLYNQERLNKKSPPESFSI